jgi:hypothetical protein
MDITRADIEQFFEKLSPQDKRLIACERLTDLQPTSWLCILSYPLPSGDSYHAWHVVYLDENGKLRLCGQEEQK